MKLGNSSRLLVAMTALIISALACAESDGGNSGEVVGSATQAPMGAPAQSQIHTVGEIIQVQDHTIVLNSYEYQGDLLKANFTIQNNGSEEITVSSLLSFSARDSQGTRLELEIFDCGDSLDGSVLPGDLLRGDICWSGASTETAKIYYEASLLSSGAVVWEVSK